MKLRTRLRDVAERLLGAPGLVRRALAKRSDQVFILAWHNIVPQGEQPAGEHSLHTDQAAFADQLDALTALLPVVTLREVLSPDWTGRGAAAVLTFDDAYIGALTAGCEELARRELRATVFVTPAFLGGQSFWWDAFADPATGRLDPRLRTWSLREWAGDDARVRQGMAELGRQAAELPPHAAAAGEDELRSAVAEGSIELASHTWSHRNLEALGPADRGDEIRRGQEWLEERFPDCVPALALPYGLGAARANEAEGPACRAVLRIEGGWATPRPVPFQLLPRFNVPRGLTPGGLRIRLAGLRS